MFRLSGRGILLWEEGKDEDCKEDGGISQICIEWHLIGRQGRSGGVESLRATARVSDVRFWWDFFVADGGIDFTSLHLRWANAIVFREDDDAFGNDLW